MLAETLEDFLRKLQKKRMEEFRLNNSTRITCKETLDKSLEESLDHFQEESFEKLMQAFQEGLQQESFDILLEKYYVNF